MSDQTTDSILRVFGTFALIFFLFMMGIRGINEIYFGIHCKGRLKRAADAISLEMAEQELDAAIKYLEDNRMTDGYTSVFYLTPDEDIGYWYLNLVSSRDQIHKMRTSVQERTELEKSNQLMKLRQTLLDNDTSGEEVTVPRGIAVYPHNLELGIGTGMSIFFLFGCLWMYNQKPPRGWR